MKKSRHALVPEVVQETTTYAALVDSICALLQEARARVARQVNGALVQTYWQTGCYIVEYEQKGKDRARYGDGLIDRLAHDLTARVGRGYSKTNLLYMRKFYLAFKKGETRLKKKKALRK